MRPTKAWLQTDIFRRVPKDLTEATYTGAIISVCCLITIALLFFGEVASYISPRIHSDMVVAPMNRYGERLKVFMDINFHKLPCAALSLDILDVLHNHELHSMDNLEKIPLDEAGREITDGRRGDEFKSEYEGCRIPSSIPTVVVTISTLVTPPRSPVTPPRARRSASSLPAARAVFVAVRP